MHPTLFLWPGEAPYSAESPGQPQPSLKAFPSESRRSAVIVCPGGGYHFSPTHMIQDNTPVENIVTMYQCAHRYGRY